MSAKTNGFLAIGLLGLSVFLIQPGEAQEAKNRYDYWAQFREGSSITFRCRTASGGSTRELFKIFSVKKVTPQSVIVEYREAAPPGVKPTAANPPVFLGGSMEFWAHEYPAADADLFGSQLDVNPFRVWENEDKAEVEKGIEDLTVQGMRIPASRTRVRFGSPSLRTTITLWRSDTLPGTIVKFRRVLEGGVSLEEEIMVAEFKSLKADPAEIARLRAERKPEAVEETGWEFFNGHFRFMNDLESTFKILKALTEAMSRLVPRGPEADWAAASKEWSRYQAASQALKDHLGDDRKRVEAILEPAEFIKLDSILKCADELAESHTTHAGVVQKLSSFAANPPPPEKIASLLEELTSFFAAFQAAHKRAQAEFMKLGSIKIKSLR
jgi:hypothetical protein